MDFAAPMKKLLEVDTDDFFFKNKSCTLGYSFQ